MMEYHPDGEAEAVISQDGSLVISPGALGDLRANVGSRIRVHVRVVPQHRRTFRGTLTDWPTLTWDDFERGSRLARYGLNAHPHR